MVSQRKGAESLIREGKDYRARAPESLPCVVRHPDAGGPCARGAVMAVYGLPFCKLHGAEAKAGALAEVYHDAFQFFERFDNPHALRLDNPEVVRRLRAAASGLNKAENEAAADEDSLLKQAYPFLADRVDSAILEYDYSSVSEYGPPDAWYFPRRIHICKLMRLSYQEGYDSLVKLLELERESASAQLAYAYVNADAPSCSCSQEA